MSRSKSRLAADWFAKLRLNASTNVVEHEDLVNIESEVLNVNSIVSGVVTATNYGAWSFEDGGTVLYISYNGVRKFKIDSNGNVTSLKNVTAYGTV